MSAVGASYVAIYHQTTQQIPAHPRKRFHNCHGRGHNGGRNDCLDLLAFSPPFSKSPMQTCKLDILSGKCKL